jgi:hypothetical protein
MVDQIEMKEPQNLPEGSLQKNLFASVRLRRFDPRVFDPCAQAHRTATERGPDTFKSAKLAASRAKTDRLNPPAVDNIALVGDGSAVVRSQEQN